MMGDETITVISLSFIKRGSMGRIAGTYRLIEKAYAMKLQIKIP